jgi:hypothetical protein
MNPFSKFLRQWSPDAEFIAFVEQWDRLERVVVGFYRGKLEPAAAAAEYTRVWPPLRALYPRWEAALRPHWQATRAAGAPTLIDPFRLLLDIPEAAAIAGDWRAMQHLPAAREAINRYLRG